MAGMTLAQAQASLDKWIAASEALAANQSYTIATATGSRTLTRANASEVVKMIDYWSGHVARLSAGGRGRTRYIVPR